MHNTKLGMNSTIYQAWPWKVEPISPPPLADLDADNLFTAYCGGDYWLASSLSNLPPPNPETIVVPDQNEVDSKPLTRQETASRLLNEIEDWIKDEPFNDWCEEKIDLPIFEELESVPLPSSRKDVPIYENKEFIDICSYNDALQQFNGKMQVASPNIAIVPEIQPKVSQMLVQQQNPNVVPMPVEMSMQSTLLQDFDFVLNNQDSLTPPDSPGVDNFNITMFQDMRTEELDELVRIRVESLVDGVDTSCSSSLHEDSSADSPSSSDSGYDDPDWTPAPETSEPKQAKRRRSNKPYARAPPEEKRQRKKEQNKNAATRYRLKKKAEIEEILGEERELQDKNQKLKTDVSELAREIKYLKNLMREVFKAKGLIK